MKNNESTYLIVMTKFPEPGKVKTRLAGELSADGACKLHAAMVNHLMTKTLPCIGEIEVQFHVAGGTKEEVNYWLEGYAWKEQIEGQLGEKMQHAIQSCLNEGADKVIIMGTDCPSITASHITSLVAALESKDVVFVPALDGGYVMAGMKDLHPEMFEEIEWSTDEVLRKSVAQLETGGKRVGTLEALSDVDLPSDVEHAAEVLGFRPWEK